MHQPFTLKAPVSALAAYVLLVVLLQAYTHDAVLSAVLADIAMAAACAWYYARRVGDIPVSYGNGDRIGLPLLVALSWFLVSVTTTWILANGWTWGLGGEAEEATGWYLLLTLAAAPVCEELMFRGLLFRALRQRMGGFAAAAVSAIAFAAYHGSVPHLYVGFACGLLFALVYARTGRLLLGILAHMSYNLLILLCSGVLSVPDAMLQPMFLLPANCLLFMAYGLLFSVPAGRGWDGDDGSGGFAQRAWRRLAAPARPVLYITVRDIAALCRPGTVLIINRGGEQAYRGPSDGVPDTLLAQAARSGSMFAYQQGPVVLIVLEVV